MRFSVGIDVGGTFTDLVLADDRSDVAAAAQDADARRAIRRRGVCAGLGGARRASRAAARRVPRPGRADRPRDDRHHERGPHRRRRAHRPAHDGGLPGHPRDAARRAQPAPPLRQQVRRRRAPLVPRYLRLPVRERMDVHGTVRTPLDEGSVHRGRRRAASPRAWRRSPSASCTRTRTRSTRRARWSSCASARPTSFLAVSSEILPQVRLNEPRVDDRHERVRRPGAARATSSGSSPRSSEAAFAGDPARDAVERRRRRPRRSWPATPPPPSSPDRRAGRSPASRIARGARLRGLRRRRHGRHELRRLARQGRRGAGDPRRRDQPPPDLAADDRRAHDRRRRRLDRLARRGRAAAHGAPQRRRRSRGPPRTAAAATEPTCTDADLVLGYLDPDYFLGGPDAARRRRSPGRRSSGASRGRSGSTPSRRRPRWSR